MSSLRHPVGRQSPAVYWRRRALLGLGILAVVVIVLLIVFAPKGGGAPAAETTHTRSASTPKPTSTAVPACDKDDLTVQAKTDSNQYSAESQPQLSFSITNDGSVACTVKAGSDVQVFTITSGDETYWISTDCQTDPQAYTTTLKPGADIASTPIAWDRTRSSKTTCDDDRASVPGGGATYRLSVSVNGVTSENQARFILQ